MARWDPDIELDAATIVRVLDDQFPELCAGERGVTCIGAGWDNAVWRVGGAAEPDPIAFRFTQRHIGVELAQIELDVMPRIAGLVPLPVTAATHIGAVTADVPLPWFGYSLLEGDEAVVLDHDAQAQHRLATQLGNFLAVLHGPQVREVVEGLDVPEDRNGRCDLDRVLRLASEAVTGLGAAGYELTSQMRTAFDGAVAAAKRDPLPDARTFVHGDLHVRHILANVAGDVTGVIDWGDMCISAPSIDFVTYWALLDPPARRTMLEAYGGIDPGSLAHARVFAFASCAMIAASAAQVGRVDVADRSYAAIGRVLRSVG